MRQAYQLQQLQVQKLIMTQSIQQAIAILQMPSQQLWAYVQEACLDNPLLEWVTTTCSERSGQAPVTRTRREWLERQAARGLGRNADASGLAVSAAMSLRDALLEQAGYVKTTARVSVALRYLIDCLDERGYLSSPVSELAAEVKLPEGVVCEALQWLQSFEPRGIGAGDLRECLLLQLTSLQETPAVALARRIVSEHLEDIPGTRSMRMLAELSCTRPEWTAALEVIRSLDPRPGGRFEATPVAYIIPDLTVFRVAERWIVLVNDEASPVVRLNDIYQGLAEVSAAEDGAPSHAHEVATAAELRDYLQKKSAAAASLMRSLEARRRTLHRVAEMIAHYQREFLEHGAEYLKPLTMRMVADVLVLHESTISRAVAGKYMQTPHGLFELRHFFSSALQTTSGETTAGTSVRAAIKRLIDQERKTEPLTDQDLSERLLQQGIRVSRRTVAKYREEQRIPSSSARRRV